MRIGKNDLAIQITNAQFIPISSGTTSKTRWQSYAYYPRHKETAH